ncbi:stage II sporulation protein M [Boudabousia marimammalium]|uniref:Stage II sporulation protein M n=1 Tax=Boudabousia marimammalium TaxID=156892 RepID=A0A1Q5PRK3_9ACTO|nr:stage II sporulation protein M [Boudabousia marimammalium]OKL50207.1 hypothetical protein BM477_02095 [Boudabousia marimammalium]
MDIDALEAVRRPEWQRLEELLAKRRISGAEADEMAALYRFVAADLSRIKQENADVDTVRYISNLVQRARGQMTRRRGHPMATVSRFVTAELPAALYLARWWIIAAYAFSIAVACAFGFYWYNNEDLLLSLAPESALRAYANDDFVNYYSENPAALFGTQVWTNNALLAVVSAVTGITGVVPIYILYGNSTMLGQTAAIVSYFGSPGLFFSYILPHGLLELSAIYVATGAGLRMFWSLLAPGRRTRMEAMGREGRALLTIGIGLILILLVSGIEEAYLTPSSLPVWLKITIGASTTILLWIYILVLGKRAADADAGHTGIGSEAVSGYYQPVS